MISSANKKYLRKLSMSYRPLFQIGKEGISYNMIQSMNDSLEAHELLKVSLLKTSPIETREAAIECASQTHSDIIHIVGHTFVLYRRSKENKLGLKK